MLHYKLQSKITVRGIKKPSELIMASLGALQYKCANGSCAITVPLQSLHTHLSLCTGAPAPFQKPTHRLTSHYLLDAPTNSTPSTVEHRVLGHFTRKMMTSSCVHSSDNTITVPTGQACCRNKTKQNCHKNQSGPK